MKPVYIKPDDDQLIVTPEQFALGFFVKGCPYRHHFIKLALLNDGNYLVKKPVEELG